MLSSIFFKNRDTAGRYIAEGLRSDYSGKRCNQFIRETLRISRKRFIEDDPGEFPVTDNAVLASGTFGKPAISSTGVGNGWHTLNISQIPDSETP
jgi:hypothetical protein